MTDAPTPAAEDLSLLGHDIRAAISDVVGGLRLIDTEPHPPEVAAQLARVRLASEGLAALVDRALTAAVGDAGPIRAGGGEVFPLAPYLADLEARWTAHAAAAGATFTLLRRSGLPEALETDRLSVDRVLSNLLYNAVRFSNGGEVTLRVSPEADRSLCFCVCDRGPGFSEAALATLFQRQGRPGDLRPGTGLGLHIAKAQVDQLGGTLTVANRTGGGAIVTFVLPVGTGVAVPLPDLSGLRILLAEDNATSQLLIGGMLERMGAEVVVASDGAVATDHLSRSEFDVALLDIEMPKRSGIELIAALRAGPGTTMPLVALTAYVLRANRDAIFAAGADGIIAKPVSSIHALGRAVRRHVDYADRRPGDLGALEEASPADFARTFDLERFRELLVAAGPDREELLRRLNEDLESVARRIGAARDARDFDEIRAQTHILISLAGAVGAARLQYRASRLNQIAQACGDIDAPAQVCRDDIAQLLDRIAAAA